LAISANKETAICGPCSWPGALAIIRYAKIHVTKHRPWLTALLARRPTKVAAIALANKIARMVWAMMVKGERYKEPVARRHCEPTRHGESEATVRHSLLYARLSCAKTRRIPR